MINRTRERAKTDFVRCHFTGQRHRHESPPVESAAKGNEPGSFGICAGNLHCVFHRFCPGGEECRLHRPVNRHTFIDTFRQSDIAFVGNNLVSGMSKRLELFFDGGDDFWVTMPGIQHCNTSGKIDHLTAFHIPQCCVFRPLSVKATHHADPARRRLQTPFIQFVILHFLPLRCAQPIGKCLPGGEEFARSGAKKTKTPDSYPGF